MHPHISDQPKRIFRTCTIADVPKFVIADELIKAARYAKKGWDDGSTKSAYYTTAQESRLSELTAKIEGRMNTAEISELMGISQSGACKLLQILHARGIVDREKVSFNCARLYIYWRI
jgi:hypothetical protein